MNNNQNNNSSNYPNNNSSNNNDISLRIKVKIDNYFNNKYPTTYPIIGLTDENMYTLINKSIILPDKYKQLNKKEKNKMLSQNINNLISIIERKIKTNIYSENRNRKVVNTNKYTLDDNANIPYNDFSINFNNKKMTGHTNPQKNNKIEDSKQNYSGLNESEIEGIMLTLSKDDDTRKNISLQEGHLPELKDKLAKVDNIAKVNNDNLNLFYEEDREFDYNIVIDSKDRDFTRYVSPNNFVIDFSPPNGSSDEINNGYVNKSFNNIIKCELVNVILLDTSGEPDSTDKTGSIFPYLLLELPELGNNYEGTNDELSRTFALLTSYETVNGYKYYYLNGVNSDSTIKKIYNPRINLNKLNIKIKTPNGELYNFGDANNDNTDTVLKITFRITVLQKYLGTNYIR